MISVPAKAQREHPQCRVHRTARSETLGRRRVVLRLPAHPSGVIIRTLSEDDVCVGLCWAVRVGGLKELLDPQQDLLHSDAWPPSLILVEDAQADCPRWVDVWMEKAGREAALGRLRRVVLTEFHGQGVEAALPVSLVLARYVAFPFHQVHRPVLGGLRSRVEPVRLVLAPRLALLRQPAACHAGHGATAVPACGAARPSL
mmetsp:Transcript_7647/g.23024  ORF Transcript_7647/g.23024 Transcript_7647/m.23024 type:complete len:201 (+) Transcript_7647:70-672(+)